MSNQFEELLRGEGGIGTMEDMPCIGTQKLMHMFFIVDKSGSMWKERIANVNLAFREMIPKLQSIQREVNDAFELYISILTFGTEACWEVEPTPILEYVHSDIVANGGGTDYANAFRCLQAKLSKTGYMAHKGKIAEPYIMLMTDGEPNNSDYESILEELKRNLWFSYAQRYAVLIGKDAIHSESARAAVRSFVTDEKEGIVTADAAVQIASVVSAKTIHTIQNMTLRAPYAEPEPETAQDRRENTTERGGGSSAENPYGDNWTFDDPGAIYGAGYVF